MVQFFKDTSGFTGIIKNKKRFIFILIAGMALHHRYATII